MNTIHPKNLHYGRTQFATISFGRNPTTVGTYQIIYKKTPFSRFQPVTQCRKKNTSSVSAFYVSLRIRWVFKYPTIHPFSHNHGRTHLPRIHFPLPWVWEESNHSSGRAGKTCRAFKSRSLRLSTSPRCMPKSTSSKRFSSSCWLKGR